MDVLVQSLEGRNLFVVEAKAAGSQLTDEDRNQGASYARLLQPMAPFVLVTSGSESDLFDTITLEPLSGVAITNRWGQWRDGSPLATTEDLRIRYEALGCWWWDSKDEDKARSDEAAVGRSKTIEDGKRRKPASITLPGFLDVANLATRQPRK